MNLSPHPWLHPIFEMLGYALGYAFFRRSRNRYGDVVDDDQRWLLLAAGAIGALLGSRILALLEQAPRLQLTWRTVLLPGGKTVVGGLLGGWIAVELVKRLRGIRSRAGDLFAVPLCLGIAVGRIGCFLAGPADNTYGFPTGLPWAVNFGDGVARHPTQLYEVLFLTGLGLILHRYNQRPQPEGASFSIFLAAYLAWRLLIDFIKPQPHVYGLTLIQWACVAGLVALLPELMRFFPNQRNAIRSTR
jgi:phosphatidylglycerol---prolipoprotein diacylglyceryl transferase